MKQDFQLQGHSWSQRRLAGGVRDICGQNIQDLQRLDSRKKKCIGAKDDLTMFSVAIGKVLLFKQNRRLERNVSWRGDLV